MVLGTIVGSAAEHFAEARVQHGFSSLRDEGAKGTEPPKSNGRDADSWHFLDQTPPNDWWRNNCRVRTQIWQFGKEVYYINNHFFWWISISCKTFNCTTFLVVQKTSRPKSLPFTQPTYQACLGWHGQWFGGELWWAHGEGRFVWGDDDISWNRLHVMFNDIHWRVWLSSASPINNIQYFWVSRSLFPMASVAKDR